MKTINFKGTIVGPMYDCEFFAEWIDNGTICPSSRVIKALDRLEDGTEATVFVDTPGGDVFAGDAIIISALNARKRCGALDVEIGSEACSMGANFVAAMKAAGARVKCHANSKVMFHSAAVGVVGGAELLKDRAALVDQINASVKANLAAIGIADCEEWFAEGREKWLSSEELLNLGLVDEIIVSNIEKPDLAEGLTAFRAAALKKVADEATADRGETAAPTAAETTAPTAADPAPTADLAVVRLPDPAPEAERVETAAPVAENWEARFKGASKKINELTADRDALLAKLNEFVAQAEADMTLANKNFTDQLEAAKKDLAEATAKVSELSAQLEEKATALKVKEEELGKTVDALAKSEEHAQRLESGRQLLTAGVLTPEAESAYEEQMRQAKTPEQREALRAKKAKGKIK